MRLNVEFTFFPTRVQRAQYIAARYRDLLHGKVLDVGCDSGALKALIPHADYTGIDAVGTPDILLNLEQVSALPFADNTFDCVICTDVLEHLNNLHAMFGELLRVSKGSVILSLPNCWSSARQPIQRGRGSFLHYGLPLEPPVDRHKWFFNITDAISFLEGHRRDADYSIEELHITEKPRAWFRKALRRLAFPNQQSYLNRYANTLWTVLRKESRAGAVLRRVA